jgi:tetratricopeptide (TPR) repeat protein
MIARRGVLALLLVILPSAGTWAAAPPAKLTLLQEIELRRTLEWDVQVIRLFEQGKAQEAIPLAQKVLIVHWSILGEEHPSSVMSMSTLGLLYLTTGEHKHALRLFQQALPLSKSVYGDKHPAYAAWLNDLADLYQRMGDDDKAKPLIEQAQDRQVGVGG